MMTFLNPLVLFGLAAAAIPIIIHLLNIRKLRRVEFSSLRFLRELQKTRMRRVKLRQWLLLLLRTLIIVALVMAFARPALRGGLAGLIGTHARTTSVVVLDDSPSMGIRSDRGIVFSRAKEAALQAASLLEEGDEMVILRLSETGRQVTPAPVRTREEAAALLGPAEVSAVTVPYGEAFGAAARILGESRNFNRELYLLTDLQKTQFAVPESSDMFDDRVRVFVAAPSLPRPENAGITDVAVASRILVPGRPVQVRTTVRNFGSAPMHNGLISVYLDGTRVLQQSADIAPGGTLATTLAVTPKRRGIIHGSVRLEDDVLEIDNRREFVVDVPENIRLLVAGPAEADTRLAALAFTLAGDSAAAALAVRTISEAQLSSVDFAAFDAVITCGIRDFSPSEATRLAQFVAAGGGMLIFPGDATDLPNYNAGLFAALAIPPAAPPVDHGGGTDGASGYLSFGTVDYAHPLFTGLFDEGMRNTPAQRTVESPQVYRSIVLQPGAKGQSVITLSDGSAFLAEYTAGNGRVLVAAVEAGMVWSDFPLKGLFVPLLHRAASYLASRRTQTASFVTGRQPVWNLRILDRSDRDVFIVRAPDNTEEKVVPRFNPASGMASFVSAPAVRPGIYDLQRETAGRESRRTLAATAVNPDPAESNLEQADGRTLEEFWSKVGLTSGQILPLRSEEDLPRTVHEARFGVELWKYFAGLAALLALLEMVIGREGKPETGKGGDTA
jgi:hypothetical protein